MTNLRRISVSLAFMSATLVPTVAAAQLITYKLATPPAAADEINSTVITNLSPSNTSATLVAAGLMGAKFFNGASVSGKATILKNSCFANRTIGNNWPDSCDLAGMAKAMTQTFAPQNWVSFRYLGSGSQNAAINRQIDGIAIDHSPVLVPIWGNTDHWVTVFEITADRSTTPYTLSNLKYFDAGTPGPNVNDPWVDSDYNSYDDGIKIAGSVAWKGKFYILLSEPPGCAPNCNEFVELIEPPSQKLFWEPPPDPTSLNFAILPGVILDGEEMDARIAQERVLDSLFFAGVYEDPTIQAAVEGGTPGMAYPVYAEDLDGEFMDYYLVPILNDDGNAVAIVRLSMKDGGFEEIWVPTRPLPFLGIGPEEAEFIARGALSSGEALVGGYLTWSPRNNLGGSELRPYYEFYIIGMENERRARIGVSLFDGRVRGVDNSLPVQENVSR